MKKVLSASRRTDLVAFFPQWFSSVLKEEKVKVFGPSGYAYAVDLNPLNVHTIVLWSKDFSNILENAYGLYEQLRKYDQLYLHFTITGLGQSFIEPHVPSPSKAILQLKELVKLAGSPDRITVRFDPVVYWKEHGKVKTNLYFFEKLAPKIYENGVKDVRFSFAQWYNKAKRRAKKHGFLYIDPPIQKKRTDACYLVDVAKQWGLRLYSCCQRFLEEVPGVQPSACIDGAYLERIHPLREQASLKKDKTQRLECRCTESVDIGSYTQYCPHCCLYCYANPKI